MKLYQHDGPGHFLGACVIVLADTQEDAEKLIRAELDDNGLSMKPLRVCELPMVTDTVVYSHNGDY